MSLSGVLLMNAFVHWRPGFLISLELTMGLAVMVFTGQPMTALEAVVFLVGRFALFVLWTARSLVNL
jgi:hypothetical protein